MEPVSDPSGAQVETVDPAAAATASTEDFNSGARLRFDEGLVGLSDWQQFEVRADPANAPILELDCVSQPGISLLAIDPKYVADDYRFELSEADRRAIKLESDEQADVLVLLVVRGQPPRITANLAGPLVINLRLGLARQIVLDGERYPLRHPVAV